ncbi:uncharacterized protein A4U43_C07F32740 [Asparagus officinalis]|uniref:N-acetyltransferase domain-containing protein n=1 Tax=Asparagus officinalis TaxID=4686 RepID=A0A5P1ELV7_ASPOF|nr:uncharacterized protein LOC109850217 [Asparagus officinalis]ONK65030.1 uncharacterized protein A4U43_C07F32740 [Asparagus officinalis]
MEKIPTTNITLRLFRPSDADEFMAWESDDRVMKFVRRDLCTTKESATEYITTYVANHPFCRAICIGDRPVGWVSVWPAPGEDYRKASIGYCIRYDHWGRGIATLAVKTVVATIFKKWSELERLEATVEITNVGSVRVLGKVGFKREGLLRRFVRFKGESRDVFVFSFLSTDPLLD